jgi:hypothetical protein
VDDDPSQPVSVSGTVNVPADRLFEILALPANHPRIDGSGMLVRGSEVEIAGVGDVFTMIMHNDEMGDYEMANHVVAYDVDRRIAWEPVLKSASRAEDQDDIGVRNGVRWSYELQPLDKRSTLVTEIYDCRAAPYWLRHAVKNGARWVDSMTTTLTKLNELAEDGT